MQKKDPDHNLYTIVEIPEANYELHLLEWQQQTFKSINIGNYIYDYAR